MASFSVYNLKGEKVGTVDRPSFFEAEIDTKLIHRYLTWVRTMLRPTLAHTKTRGEVSGGGKKPWKQKGTGRARVGSTRSPLWRKGGITFGPRKEQTWATRMPRTERRKALFSALSAKAQIDNVIVVDSWNPELPKTKEAELVLKNLIKKEKAKVLHINTEAQGTVAKSLANLPYVTTATPSRLNVKSVLDNDVLVLTQDTLQALDEHFLTSL